MRIAFVGTEAEFHQIEHTFHDGGAFRLAAVVPLGAPDWRPSGTIVAGDVDAILDEPEIDVLLLAGSVTQRSEQLRRTLQSGRHAVVWLPLDTSATPYHEAGCMATDSGLVVLPWLWRAVDPAFCRLLELTDRAQFGLPQGVQINFRGPSGTGRELIFGVYAELADLLRRLVGELDELTAIGEPQSGSVRVHHRAESGATGEIAILGCPGSVELTIAVQFAEGSAELQFAPCPGDSGRLIWQGRLGSGEAPSGAFSHAAYLFARLGRSGEGSGRLPSWSDATRAAELAECAWLSLERRRAIDIHHEHYTELTQFKARMTTVGCGLVWAAILVLFLVAAGESLRIPGMRYVLLGLGGLFVLFLLLQLLRAIVPESNQGNGADPPQER